MVNPEVIPGTRLRRTFVAPEPDIEIGLGDIVQYRGRRWDVAGSGTELGDSGPITVLLLECRMRTGQESGRITRRWVPEHEVYLLWRQVLVLDPDLLRSDRRDTMSDPTTNESTDLSAKVDALAARLQEVMAALSEATGIAQEAVEQVKEVVQRLKDQQASA